jgi:RND superfamily putative drug exporter
VILLWLIAAIAIIGFAPKLGDYTTANQQTFLSQSYQSVQAQNVGNANFPDQSGASGSLVVNRADGAVLSQDDKSKVSSLAASLENDHIPSVASVTIPPNSVSTNGKVEIVAVYFKGQAGDEGVNTAVVDVRDKTSAYLQGSGLDAGLTGNAATSVDSNNAYDNAEKIIGIATVLLILFLLALIFRSPIVAVLPIVVIFVIHSMAQGLTASLAKGFGFEVGNSLGPLLIVVMFGVGTDYIVFSLFRYRDRLRAGEPHSQALPHSSAAIGRVIASSALTVMIAFAALLLASLGSLQTLAPGLIVGVALMLLAALTLVPALFSVLGNHLFWPGGIRTPRRDPFSARFGRLVAAHPARILCGLVVVLVVLSLGSSKYAATYNTLAELPSNTPSLEAYNTMASAFPPGVLGPTQVYVNGTAPLSSTSLNNLTTRLAQAQGVAEVAPPQLSADKTAALVTVILKNNPYSTVAMDNVQGPVRQAAHGSVPGDQVLVGGQTSTLVDVRQSIHSSTRVVFPVAFALIAVILGLLLLSIVAPVNLLAGVALTYAATLGALSLVFITATGDSGIDFSNPIVLYLFVIAIGTDYNILMSDRLRDEFLRGRSPKEMVVNAITYGAPAVWTAGVILAGTFASLLISGIANLVELGFGVMVGIVVAAFVLAPVMIPCLARLEGRVFWWPGKPHDVPGAPVMPPLPEAGEREPATVAPAQSAS